MFQLKKGALASLYLVFSILFFIGVVGGFLLSSHDIRTTDSLSDDYLNEITQKNSFRNIVYTIADAIDENTDVADSLNDAYSVKYVFVKYNPSLSATSISHKLIRIYTREGDDVILQLLSSGFKVVSEEKWNELTSNTSKKYSFSSKEYIYKGVDLELIKEFSSEEKADIIYSWLREDIKSKDTYKHINQLVCAVIEKEYAHNISSINCALISDSLVYFKVNFDNGRAPLYWKKMGNTIFEFNSFVDKNTDVYEKKEVEVLLKEAGIR